MTHSRSGFHPLLDLFPVVSCVIISSPLSRTQGLHRAGASTPHGLELNKNPSYISSQLTVVFREEGKGVERK